MVTVRNKFDTRQETSEMHIPNDEYEIFLLFKLSSRRVYTNETKMKNPIAIISR